MDAEVKTRPEVGTPYGRLVAIRATSLMQRLLTLDDLWTEELERMASGEPVPDSDIEVLGQLVSDMQRGLEELPDAAYELRLMLDELGPERFDQILDAFGDRDKVPWDVRETLAEMLPDYEPQSAAIAACDYIRETAPSEAALLTEKLETIRRGEATPGDFLMPFRCAGYLLGIGSTVAAGAIAVVAGGPVAPAALGLVYPAISFIEDWRERGCRVELPTISFQRRAA